MYLSKAPLPTLTPFGKKGGKNIHPSQLQQNHSLKELKKCDLPVLQTLATVSKNLACSSLVFLPIYTDMIS